MQERRRIVRVDWCAPLGAAHDGAGPGPRELELVQLRDDDGCWGCGEGAWLPGYDGVSAAEARLAATDMAGWDLRGRRAGVPVWELLGAERAPSVEVNATIGAEAPAAAASAALAAVQAGFRTLKVKVGAGDDVARVAAVRGSAGPGVAIRVDANGAWGVDQAVRRLRALSAYGLELCEEPVHGVEALAAVVEGLRSAGVAVPVAADESAGAVLAVGSVGSSRTVCAAVCLKVARGGITAVVDDAARARALGYEVYLASTLDGPLGIAAALHAAAVVAPDRACGLATLERFDRAAPLRAAGGVMRPPPGAGLGDGLLEWYDGQDSGGDQGGG